MTPSSLFWCHSVLIWPFSSLMSVSLPAEAVCETCERIVRLFGLYCVTIKWQPIVKGSRRFAHVTVVRCCKTPGAKHWTWRNSRNAEARCGLFPAVPNAIIIALTLPVTTCTTERSFRTLRRVYTVHLLDRQCQMNACPVYAWWAFSVKKSPKASTVLLKGWLIALDEIPDVWQVLLGKIKSFYLTWLYFT